ncbi:putative peroxidase-related enzyme [Rhizobium sp. BK376]|nr:putative peroxidase-related enzyme [Rhizobium sp. BK376]
MSRIPTPATVQDAPAKSQPMLEAGKQLGVVPNLFRLVATSPAALEGYLGVSGALAKGTLSAATRERIALAVAEVNGCSYCLSAHSYLAKNIAKLDEAEITANRDGHSNDAKADVAVHFAAKLAHARGRVSEADVDAVKSAGYSGRAGDRDHTGRRSQHLDQLSQRSAEDRNRFSAGSRTRRRLM